MAYYLRFDFSADGTYIPAGQTVTIGAGIYVNGVTTYVGQATSAQSGSIGPTYDWTSASFDITSYFDPQTVTSCLAYMWMISTTHSDPANKSLANFRNARIEDDNGVIYWDQYNTSWYTSNLGAEWNDFDCPTARTNLFVNSSPTGYDGSLEYGLAQQRYPFRELPVSSGSDSKWYSTPLPSFSIGLYPTIFSSTQRWGPPKDQNGATPTYLNYYCVVYNFTPIDDVWHPSETGSTAGTAQAAYGAPTVRSNVGYALSSNPVIQTIECEGYQDLYPGTVKILGPATGGRTVTVTGYNLSTVNSVKIVDAALPGGEVAATDVVANPSGLSLTFTLPEIPDPLIANPSNPRLYVNVVVTSPSVGSSAYAPNGYNFIYYSPVSITSIVPNEVPLVGVASLVINGWNLPYQNSSRSKIFFNEVDVTELVDWYRADHTEIQIMNLPSNTVLGVDEGLVYVTVQNDLETSAQSLDATFVFGELFPVIESVSPSLGVDTGGTEVTVTGLNLDGVTEVLIGAVSVTSFETQSATEITLITPDLGSTQGERSVVAKRGESSSAQSFSFFVYTEVAITPPVTGTLSAPYNTGGGRIQIDGTGFNAASGSSVVIEIDGVIQSSFFVSTAIRLEAAAPAIDAPQVLPSIYDVHVVKFVGVTEVSRATVSAAFTYTDGLPDISDLTPNELPLTGGVRFVEINGTFFNNITEVSFGSTVIYKPSENILLYDFVRVSSSQLTFVVPEALDVEVRAVTVTTSTGTDSENFTFYRPLTADTVSPTTGDIDGGLLVSIQGTGFTGVSEVAFGKDGIFTAGIKTVISDSSLTVRTPVQTDAGVYDIRITNTREQITLVGAFTYIEGPPTFGALTPAKSLTSGGTSNTLYGTKLHRVTGITIDGVALVLGNGVDVGTYQINGRTSITISPPVRLAGIGTVDLVVSWSSVAGSGNQAYSFFYGVLPDLQEFDPASGSPGQLVVLRGEGFTGAVVTFGGGPGVYIDPIQSDTEITVRVPYKPAGLVAVRVTTAFGFSELADFEILPPAPTVSSLSPDWGIFSEETLVTIYGSNLQRILRVEVGSGDDTVVLTAPTECWAEASGFDWVVKANFPSWPTASSVNVKVVTTTGEYTVNNGFSYRNPLTVTTFYDDWAVRNTPKSITIEGSGFSGGSTPVVKFGSVNGTNVVRVSDSQLTVTTPSIAEAGAWPITVETDYGTAVSGQDFTFYNPVTMALSPSAAPKNTPTLVTITGNSLDTVYELYFDGQLIPTQLWSYDSQSDTIAFTTPAPGLGRKEVKVVGTFDEDYAYFRYCEDLRIFRTLGGPDFDWENIGPSVGGDTVKILGSGFAEAAGVRFGLDPGSPRGESFQIVNDGEIRISSPAVGAGLFQIVVEGLLGDSVWPAVEPTDNHMYRFVDPPFVNSLTPNSGRVTGGEIVDIDGDNLQYAYRVLFGENNSPWLNALSTPFKARTPSTGTVGPVDVVVFSPGGMSDPVQFTYTNSLPVAVASMTPLSGEAMLTVEFDAQGSYDPDGGLLSYEWDFGDGGTSLEKTGGHLYRDVGTYNAKLTVTDSTGATAESETFVITVSEPVDNQPPVAIGAASMSSTLHEGVAPLFVYFSSASTDADGQIVEQLWDFGDGDTSTVKSVSHVYENDTEETVYYTATLTVTDNNGAIDTEEWVITVHPRPPLETPILAHIAPTQGSSSGVAVRLNGSKFIEGGMVTGVFVEALDNSWTRDGTILRVINDGYMSAILPPGPVGETVNVRLTKDDGYDFRRSQTHSETKFTYVPGPTVTARGSIDGGAYTTGPIRGYGPLTVAFQGSATPVPGRTIVSWFWDFDTPNVGMFDWMGQSNLQNPTFTFPADVYRRVTLTVIDSLGISSSVTIIVDSSESGSPGSGPRPNPIGGGGGGGLDPNDPWPGGEWEEPPPRPPQPPVYIDSTCTVDSGIRNDGWRSNLASVGPWFSARWTARHYEDRIKFTVTGTFAKTVLNPDPENLDPNRLDPDRAALYPVKMYIGARNITADYSGSGAPSISSPGFGTDPSAGGVLVSNSSGLGLFTPRIGDGTAGITQGQTFRMSISASTVYDIAVAEIGFLDQFGRPLGSVGLAWINVDCDLYSARLRGWVVGSVVAGSP